MSVAGSSGRARRVRSAAATMLRASSGSSLRVPVGGDVVGADHPGRQFGVARLLRRPDRRHPVLPGGLQATAAGDREAPQQAHGGFQAGSGARGDRAVVGLGRPGPQPGRRVRRFAGRVQVRILGEDAGLQAPQPGAGVDAQPSGQQGAGPAQYGEGVRLPSGPVQGECEQAPGLLAPGVFGEVRVQVGDRLGGAAELHEQLRAAFDGAQPQLGEPGAFPTRPVRGAELGVGGSPPLPQGRPQPVGSLRGRQSVRLGDGGLEAPRVHGVRRRAQGVSRALGDEQPGGGARRAVRFQGAAQVPDEGAHRSHGPGRRRVPEVLHQAGDRDDPPPGQDEPGEHGPVPGALQGERVRAAPGGDRSEYTERDRFHGPCPVRSRSAAARALTTVRVLRGPRPVADRLLIRGRQPRRRHRDA
ncbi:hypothetical protein RKD29_006702 [Streptomyces tendae]